MRLAHLAILLVACSGGKTDDSASTGDGGFAEIRDDILFKSCALSTCHGPGEDGAVESGLTFDPGQPDAAYDAIVNATAATGKVLVTPGDLDNSFLVVKVLAEQDATEGDPMPPPFGLDAQGAAKIVAWVEAGAPNN